MKYLNTLLLTFQFFQRKHIYFKVQDPPVAFASLPDKGSRLDTDFLKPYTKSGTHVDFVVWPPLLLYENGPILAKGVAQGYDPNT